MNPPRQKWRAALLILAFLAAALWPLVAYPDLHLQDFPNHLARAFILLHPGDPVLLQNYRVVWSVLPDLGWDLWAVALGQFLPLVLAGKLMVLFAFVLGIGGCFVLGRAQTGGWSLVPLLAFPFLLNGAYAKGFLSFEFGLALSLWAMAWWAIMPERLWLLRLMIATALATLLYVIHLYAFALYGVFVLGFELKRSGPGLVSRLITLCRDGLQAAPALLLFLLAAHAAPHAGGIAYRNFLGRFGDISLLIESGRPWLDIAVILAFAGITLFAAWKNWLRFSPAAATVLTLYVALFFLLPDGVINTAYLAWRIVLPLIFVGIASLRPGPAMPRLFLPGMLVAAFAITLAVPLIEAPGWSRSQQEKSQFLSLIAPVPDGSKIFFAQVGMPDYAIARDAPGAYHIAAYGVIAKRLLVQTMFVSAGQHVLRFRDDAMQGPVNGPVNNSDPLLQEIADNFRMAHADLGDYIGRFDYVVLRGRDAALENRVLPQPQLILVGEVGDYRLFRVGRG